ncbi:MAG: DUF2202 domain-containing protein [Candidatus Bipolaricaulota bacterium]
MKRIPLIGLVVAGLLVSGVLVLGAGGWRWSQSSAVVQASLPYDVSGVVLEALVGPDGEYAAYATYAAIVQEYGYVEPYASILASEARHIVALQRILDRYAVSYPVENPYLGVVEIPASLENAAQAGVDAEIANVALYDAQVAAVSAYADITRVFSNLRRASLEAHLPAFELALQSGGSF